MAKLRTILLIINLIIVSTFSTHAVSYSTNSNSMFFWRADPSQFVIENAYIFPQLSLTGPQVNLQNLGKAWIGWNLNYSGQLRPVYASYDQGELTKFNSFDRYYDKLIWYGIEDSLFLIAVTNTQTDVYIILEDGTFFRRQILGATTDHQIYVSNRELKVYAVNKRDNQSYIYTARNLQVREVPTSDRIIAGGLLGYISDNGTVRTLVLDTGNTTLPDTLSNNLFIGHLSLNPVIYDIKQELIWSLENIITVPVSITKISFYGFQSSLIYSNGTILEYDMENLEWIKIAEFSNPPLDFSIVDIGLYIGPTRYHGLGIASSGLDEDQDGAPDTVEDYKGSLSTIPDSDGDGILDGIEIAFGLDPTNRDADLDYDGDKLKNSAEIEYELDPLNPDSDYGGALDGWEVKFNKDPSDPRDDLEDNDNDGITNALESQWGSDPEKIDTDDDGIPDRWEIENGIDPTIDNANDDPDGDGLSNIQEYRLGTDPLYTNPRSLFDELFVEIILLIIIMIPVAYRIWRKFLEDFE